MAASNLQSNNDEGSSLSLCQRLYGRSTDDVRVRVDVFHVTVKLKPCSLRPRQQLLASVRKHVVAIDGQYCLFEQVISTASAGQVLVGNERSLPLLFCRCPRKRTFDARVQRLASSTSTNTAVLVVGSASAVVESCWIGRSTAVFLQEATTAAFAHQRRPPRHVVVVSSAVHYCRVWLVFCVLAVACDLDAPSQKGSRVPALSREGSTHAEVRASFIP